MDDLDHHMIGEMIRRLREAKGMSQGKLAELIGVSYQQIQSHEQQDKIQARRLMRIAQALEAPLSAFLGPEVRELEGLPVIPAPAPGQCRQCPVREELLRAEAERLRGRLADIRAELKPVQP